MNQLIGPFESFSPGCHLIIGDAGSGKTRLMWVALQNGFLEGSAINIVLTDSQKNAWYLPSKKPITTLDPYSTDVSWASNPKHSGIYYCACEYIPRIITFLECLATWSIQSENEKDPAPQTVRIFLDFSSKHWMLPEFVEQVSRLHYISSTRNEDHAHPIELWVSQGLSAKIPTKVRAFFSGFHIIMLNPAPSGWAKQIPAWLNAPGTNGQGAVSPVAATLQNADLSQTDGFYYATQNGDLSLYGKQLTIDS
ncbi:MAG: hypothetical protein FWF88_08795 [Peptococcaceae bacterium]|nr:hypothetical protein [Peptococcaceae bacterium]